MAFAQFLAVPHWAYLMMKMLGPNGVITINGCFERSDSCDTEFNRISQSFGMQEELAKLKESTHNSLPPLSRPSSPDLSFHSSVHTKKVQVHPTDPTKTALITNNLSPA